MQVADEYGSETYRGAVDVILHDPTGKEIHHARAIQDDEIEVEAHGTKAMGQGWGQGLSGVRVKNRVQGQGRVRSLRQGQESTHRAMSLRRGMTTQLASRTPGDNCTRSRPQSETARRSPLASRPHSHAVPRFACDVCVMHCCAHHGILVETEEMLASWHAEVVIAPNDPATCASAGSLEAVLQGRPQRRVPAAQPDDRAVVLHHQPPVKALCCSETSFCYPCKPIFIRNPTC